jgi:hypothetical protein
MHCLVFAHRGNARAADRFAARLEGEGHSVARANSRWYAGELYKEADVIYHDGSVPDLELVHQRVGIRCQYVVFDEVGQTPDRTPPSSAPVAQPSTPSPLAVEPDARTEGGLVPPAQEPDERSSEYRAIDAQVEALKQGEPAPPAEAYTLEKKGAWWSIYDRAGQKVGKASMDEAEARATLNVLNAGD